MAVQIGREGRPKEYRLKGRGGNPRRAHILDLREGRVSAQSTTMRVLENYSIVLDANLGVMECPWSERGLRNGVSYTRDVLVISCSVNQFYGIAVSTPDGLGVESMSTPLLADALDRLRRRGNIA